MNKKLNKLYLRFIYSDTMRYFHMSPWSDRVEQGLRFGALIAILFALFVGFAWYQYDLKPHFPTFVCGVPLSFLIGFIFGLFRGDE